MLYPWCDVFTKLKNLVDNEREIGNILDFCTQQEFWVTEIKKSLQNNKNENNFFNLQYLLPTPFNPLTSKSLLVNVVTHRLSKRSCQSSKASSEHSSKHSSKNSSKHSSKHSPKYSSKNSNSSRELNVIVSDPSNFEVIANPHSVAVLNDAVKNDTILPQEILLYFTRTESFDPANYSNNTPTKSSLSSSNLICQF